jgi:hypothetical protein
MQAGEWCYNIGNGAGKMKCGIQDFESGWMRNESRRNHNAEGLVYSMRGGCR